MTIPTSFSRNETDIQERNLYESMQASSSSGFGHSFPKTELGLFQLVAKLSRDIYSYKSNPEIINPFFDLGWEILMDSDRFRPKDIDSQMKARISQACLSDGSTLIMAPSELRAKARAHIESKSGPIIASDGYFGLALVHRESRVMIVVNEGTKISRIDDLCADAAIFLGEKSEQNLDAITFARYCKQQADELGFQITFSGHSLGGYQSHLQGAIVGGKAIGIDSPLVSKRVLGYYQAMGAPSFDELKKNPNIISIQSNPNAINLGGGSDYYGTVYRVDVLEDGNVISPIHKTLKSHSIDAICKKIEEGRLQMIHALPSTKRMESSLLPLSMDPDTERKIFFHSLTEHFKTTAQEFTEPHCIALLSSSSAESPSTLLETPKLIEISEIEAMLEQVSSESKKLEDLSKTGNEILREMETEFKRKNDMQKVEILLSFADEIASELYRDQQQRNAQNERKRQRERLDRGLRSLQEGLHTKHHQQPQNLSLQDFQRSVFWNIHPSGNLKIRFKEMEHSISDYQKTQKRLTVLLETRKKRQVDLEGQELSLSQLDQQIRGDYQRLIDSRQEVIQTLGKVSTGLNIGSSISAWVPGVGTLLSAGLGLASRATSFFQSRKEERLMQTIDAYQQKMGETMKTRSTIADLSSQNRQEIAALEEEKFRQREILISSSDYIVPSTFRGLLQGEQAPLSNDITTQQKALDQKSRQLSSVETRIKTLEQAEANALKSFREADKIKGKKAKKRSKANAQEALVKAQQRLSEAKASRALKLKEVEYEQSKLKKLTSAQSELEAVLKREERLAPIKDYFQQAITDEIKKREADEVAIEEWRKAIAEGFAKLSSFKREERELIHTTFQGINGLCGELMNSSLVHMLSSKTGIDFSKGVQIGQTALQFGEQLYQFREQCKSLQVGYDLLSTTLQSLRSGTQPTPSPLPPSSADVSKVAEAISTFTTANPGAGLGDAIDAIGKVLFVAQYVLPALQVMTTGLALIRLGSHILQGCPRTLSSEERLLQQLGGFLTEFSQHVDHQFNDVHRHIDQNHVELLDTLSTVRLEMGVLANEVLQDIEKFQKLILREMRNDRSIDHAVQIKVKVNEIIRSRKRIKLILSDQTLSFDRTLETVKEFLINLNVDLKCEPYFDVNSGFSSDRSQSGREPEVTPLVDIGLAARNPDIYTGLIASRMKIPYRVPSLFFLNQLAKNFLTIKQKCASGCLGQEEVKSYLENGAALIREQGEIIFDFANQLPSALHFVKDEQDRILDGFRRKIQEIHEMKKIISVQTTEQAVIENKNIAQLISDEHVVGAHKFRYAKLFCKVTVGETYEFKVQRLPAFPKRIFDLLTMGVHKEAEKKKESRDREYVVDLFKQFNQLSIAELLSEKANPWRAIKRYSNHLDIDYLNYVSKFIWTFEIQIHRKGKVISEIAEWRFRKNPRLNQDWNLLLDPLGLDGRNSGTVIGKPKQYGRPREWEDGPFILPFKGTIKLRPSYCLRTPSDASSYFGSIVTSHPLYPTSSSSSRTSSGASSHFDSIATSDAPLYPTSSSSSSTSSDASSHFDSIATPDAPLYPTSSSSSRTSSGASSHFDSVATSDAPPLYSIPAFWWEYEQESLITLEEIQRFNTKAHTVDTESYKKQIKKLLNDYHQLLTSLTYSKTNDDNWATGLSSSNTSLLFSSSSSSTLGIHSSSSLDEIKPFVDNCFSQTIQKGRVISSINSQLVPLIFPKKLIDVLEIQFEQDITHMEALGLAILIPSYEFTHDTKRDRYILKLHFDYTELRGTKEKLAYGSFVIAEIDSITVKAFSKPTFTTDGDVNPPNLNEFLIQAMYTDLVEGLGLPGDLTFPLGKGRWIAPAERPFPGFFKVWERFPNRVIHFDCANYTEEVSNHLTAAVTSKSEPSYVLQHILDRNRQCSLSANYTTILKKIREAKKEQEKTIEKLKENYDLLWVYCCLITNLDDRSLHDFLESELGIINPKQFESLFCQIDWNAQSKAISSNFFSLVANKLAYHHLSPYLSQLKTVMETLGLEAEIPDRFTTKQTCQPSSHLLEMQEALERTTKMETAKFQFSHSLHSSLPGMRNKSGSDCFFNATMQLILHSPFLEFLGNESLLQKSPSGEVVNRQFFDFFKTFISDYKESTLRKVPVDYDNRAMREILRMPRGQHDCAEAFNRICEGYELTAILSVFSNRRQIDLSQKHPLITIVNEPSQPGSNGTISKESQELMLKIPLQPAECMQHLVDKLFEDKITQDCFTFEYEQNLWEVAEYTDKITPQEMKEQIFLQILRYGTNAAGNSYKINDKLPNGILEISIGGHAYQLQGFIIHKGNETNEGHYIAVCKADGGWNIFDDNIVKRLPSATNNSIASSSSTTVKFSDPVEELAKKAYILSYVKKGLMAL